MKKLLMISFAAAVLVSSCRKKTEPVVCSNDGEQTMGWCNHHTLKGDASAHSGGYVSVTDSANQFSLTLRQKLSDVTKNGAKKAMIGTWVRTSGTAAKGCLVVTVEAGGKSVMWQCLPIEAMVKEPGKWTELLYNATLPTDVTDGLISVYIWNTSKETIAVDDMVVRFE